MSKPSQPGLKPVPRHPYVQAAYAATNAQDGRQILDIRVWEMAVIERPITPNGGWDIAGSYPITPFPTGLDIPAGLAFMADRGAVSFTAVTDPCHPPHWADGTIEDAHIAPFKAHFVHEFDLSRGTHEAIYDKKTRRDVRKSQRLVEVQAHDFNDPTIRSRWVALYQQLMTRHDVAVGAQFSAASFDALASVTGLHCLAAHGDAGINAMVLFLEHDGIAYVHLAGVNHDGYRTMSQYAIYDYALRFFGQERGCRLLNLGGAPGHQDDPSHGLAKFKNSFATGTMQSHIVGIVLDKKRYNELSAGCEGDFFPRYRMPKGIR
ncbi:MAG: peptidoglycan bridge formation glycyltransferase FemA/FemB family protein [Pseudomonadota bacterium]